jgi:hypothetical protein
MNEITKYGVYKEKLQGICDENNLRFAINEKAYPFFMTVQPITGMDAQMSMMEEMGEANDTGYISPEAVIVFAYKDGDLTYKMSETINISDALFNKIKNLFKKMYACYMAYFFRDRTEGTSCADSPAENVVEDPAPAADADAVTEACEAEAVEAEVVEPDEFADFFDGEGTPAE